MKNLKKNAAALYFAVSLLMLFGEPTGDASIPVFLGYYLFALANFLASATIINKLYKR